MTTLIRLAAAGDEEGVRAALQGRDLFARDETGARALDWARRRQHAGVVRVLEDATRAALEQATRVAEAGTATLSLDAIRDANEHLAARVLDALACEEQAVFRERVRGLFEELAPKGATVSLRGPGARRPLLREDFERFVARQMRSERAAGGGDAPVRVARRLREMRGAEVVDVAPVAGSGRGAALVVAAGDGVGEEVALRAERKKAADSWRERNPMARRLPREYRSGVESCSGSGGFWADRQGEESGLNVLARCAAMQELDLVVWALELGADPDVELSSGQSPLLYACSGEDGRIVKAMLLFGADAARRSSRTGATPFHAAAGAGRAGHIPLLVQSLYEGAANSTLGAAARFDPFAAPKHWAQSVREVFEVCDREGRRAVDVAAFGGHGECVEALRSEAERLERKLKEWEERREEAKWTSCGACGERVVTWMLADHKRHLCAMRAAHLRDSYRPSTADVADVSRASVEETSKRHRAARLAKVARSVRASLYTTAAPPSALEPLPPVGVPSAYERAVARHLVGLPLSPARDAHGRQGGGGREEGGGGGGVMVWRAPPMPVLEGEALEMMGLTQSRPSTVASLAEERGGADGGTRPGTAMSRPWTHSSEDGKGLEDAVVEEEEDAAMCPLGCGIRMPRGVVGMHVGKRCARRVVPCMFGCGDRFEVRDMHLHEPTCPRRELTCSCGLVVSADRMETHVLTFCAEASEFCALGCGIKLRRSLLAFHERFECGKRMTRCPHCAGEVSFDAVQRHIDSECPVVLIPCPQCGISVARDHLAAHRLRCIVRPVPCPRCRLTVALEDLDEHLATACDAKSALCPNGCGETIFASPSSSPPPSSADADMAEHLAHRCACRMVPCPQCGESVAFRDLEEHSAAACSHRRTRCPFGCEEEIVAAFTESHRAVCAFQPVSCGVDSLRCTRQMRSWFVGGDWRKGTGRMVLCTSHGSHPLIQAAKSPATIPQLRMLLAMMHRSQIDLSSRQGHSALTAAAAAGNVQAVHELLDAGADIHACSPRGITALIAAAEANHVDVLEALLHRGADPQQRTSHGFTALRRASAAGATETAELLVSMVHCARLQDDVFRAIFRGDMTRLGLLLGDPETLRAERRLAAARARALQKERELLAPLDAPAIRVRTASRRSSLAQSVATHLDDIVGGGAAASSRRGSVSASTVAAPSTDDEVESQRPDIDFGDHDPEGEVGGDGGRVRVERWARFDPAQAGFAKRRAHEALLRVRSAARTACRVLSVMLTTSEAFHRRRAVCERGPGGEGGGGEETSLTGLPSSAGVLEGGPSVLSVGSVLAHAAQVTKVERRPSYDDEDGDGGESSSRDDKHPTTLTSPSRFKVEQRTRAVRRETRERRHGMESYSLGPASEAVLAGEFRQALGRHVRCYAAWEVAARAVDHGRALHSKNIMTHTPMTFAASCGRLDAVKMLLQCGASPEHSIAFQELSVRVVQLWWRQILAEQQLGREQAAASALQAHHPVPGDDAAFSATVSKQLMGMVRRFALHQRIRSVWAERRRERLPVIEALYNGHTEVAALLLRAGARIWRTTLLLPSSPPPFAPTRPLFAAGKIAEDGSYSLLHVGREGLGIKVPRLDDSGTQIRREDDVHASWDHSSSGEARHGGRGVAEDRRDMWYVDPNTNILTLWHPPPDVSDDFKGAVSQIDATGFLHTLPTPLFATEAATLGYERLGHRSFVWGEGWVRRDPHTQALVLALRETRESALRRWDDVEAATHARNRRERTRRLQALSATMRRAITVHDMPTILHCVVQGVDLKTEGENGHSALTVASKTELVLTAPPEAGLTLAGRALLAPTLLLQGFCETPRDLLAHEPSCGGCALHVASFHDRVDSIRALAQHGANVNQRSTGGPIGKAQALRPSDPISSSFEHPEFGVPWRALVGRTPLMFAAMSGKWRAARCLMELGADPWARDAAGQTAHEIALARDYFRVASVILRMARGDLTRETADDTLQDPEGLRTVLCRFGCGARLPLALRSDHERDLCPKAPTPCPLDCGEELWRQEVSAHVRHHCRLRRVRCPLGCPLVLRAQDLDAHRLSGCKKH
jgi:ankyrin repeat protein